MIKRMNTEMIYTVLSNFFVMQIPSQMIGL